MVSAVVRFRKALKIPTFVAKPWTPADLALLGKLPDKEVARRLQRDYKAVFAMRKKLGRPYQARQVHPWTPAEDRLLGTMPDRALARRLRRTPNAVALRRNRCGIERIRA